MDLSQPPSSPADEVSTADGSAAGPMSQPIDPARLWKLALAGTVLAGAVAAGLYEAIPTIFIPPPNMTRMMGQLVNIPKAADVIVADRKNAMVAFAIAGGLLAMVLGAAGGLARRSSRGAILGAVVGLILGAGAGAGAGTVAVPILAHQQEKDPDSVNKDLAIPLMIHVGLWATIGAACGAGLGLGAGMTRRLPAVILAGLVGGALGAGIYEVTAALLWADGRTYQIIAHKWPPRVYADFIPPLAIAFVAVSGVVSPGRRKKPATAPAPEV